MQTHEKTILIVDGDSRFVGSMAARLTAENYDVFGATDAIQAVAMFRAHAPDLIVLSMELPGGGGCQVHEQIRRLGHANTPVVYMTDRAEGSRFERAQSMNPAMILERPIDEERLAETIARLLGCAVERSHAIKRGGSMRILVVEDDELQRELIHRCLDVPGREAVEITSATSLGEAEHLLLNHRYDCVILDHNLPDGQGIDLFDRSPHQVLTTPVIGLSASEDLDQAIEYFRAGCADYFCKSEALQVERLREGITTALSNFHRKTMAMILERRELGDAIVQSQEDLITLARVDQVMGICNRAVLDEMHAAIHIEADAAGRNYGLLMVDVDNFKKYNDQYGHQAGDAVLKQVARTLGSSLRESDFIARYGGEEIVIIMDGVDGDVLARRIDQLRQQVQDLAIDHVGNDPFGVVTVSIGATLHEAAVEETGISVLLRADEAMYEAKQAGRNRAIMSGAARALRKSA